MQKGKSYLWYNDDNADHAIVKSLHDAGIVGVDLVYGSHWSTDAGWNLLNSSIGAKWLGYTLKDAFKTIEKLKDGSQ